MAPHGCKGKELIPPRFFKIILQQTLEEHKLKIPVKFVKNHGEHLQNQAIIKVPGNSTWKVELENCNGKVWLKRGWKEFADYYSLAYGHFLVFEYRGNSDFYVFIFDKTATQIDYPLSNKRKTVDELPHQDVEDSDSEDDESIEILESCSFSGKKRERSPLPSPIPRKTSRIDPTSKASAMERSNAFESQNPFFKAVMRPSYVNTNGTGYLNILYKFAKVNFKENHGQAILRVSNGRRTWTVNYAMDKQRARFRSSCTWVAFIKDNNLKVGDVCVFELLKDVEISFQVFIYRLNEGANCRPSTSQVEPGKKPVGKFVKGSSSSGVPEAAATKPYPFFKVVMQPSCFDSCGAYVPKSFSRKYLTDEKQEMQLQVGDCWWRVKVKYYPASGRVKLGAGWTAFARGNSLKVRDICTFELIKVAFGSWNLTLPLGITLLGE